MIKGERILLLDELGYGCRIDRNRMGPAVSASRRHKLTFSHLCPGY